MANSLGLLTSFFNFSSKKNCLIFIILLSLTQIQEINGAVCSKDSKIKKGDTCFNEIIEIKGRSGQFGLRKDGVLLIEYSDEGKRIFYGLKPNGRGFFPDENSMYEIEEIDRDGDSYKRYESKNMLVSLKDDSEGKQYVFSVSTYKGLTELFFS